jgi:hypothetical protein
MSSRFYHAAQKLAYTSAGGHARSTGLALDVEDERMKSVCEVTVLNRTAVRWVDLDRSGLPNLVIFGNGMA